MKKQLEEICAHLGGALMQAVASDDQIIIQHVRDAHAIAQNVWRALRQSEAA